MIDQIFCVHDITNTPCTELLDILPIYLTVKWDLLLSKVPKNMEIHLQ